jgi:hypothetical protein
VESKVMRLFELFVVVFAGDVNLCLGLCWGWVVYIILCLFASLKSSPILCDCKSFKLIHFIPPYADKDAVLQWQSCYLVSQTNPIHCISRDGILPRDGIRKFPTPCCI